MHSKYGSKTVVKKWKWAPSTFIDRKTKAKKRLIANPHVNTQHDTKETSNCYVLKGQTLNHKCSCRHVGDLPRANFFLDKTE